MIRRIRLFKSLENDITNLENEINNWIEESGAEVLSVTGNLAPQSSTSNSSLETFGSSDVLITILYQSAVI